MIKSYFEIKLCTINLRLNLKQKQKLTSNIGVVEDWCNEEKSRQTLGKKIEK